jgi:hypothetical protein
VLERGTAALLGGIVVVSWLVRSAISFHSPSVWILPDEIVYSELAKSIAAGDRPSIRGVPSFGWGEVYPAVIAPAWALFEDSVSAYHAALTINALLMSLAAVPAYLLARLFVPRGLALAVALLSVLVPSMGYTHVVLTENAFYPAFLFALYAITRAVARPTLTAQAVVLLAVGVAVLTRSHGLVLVAVYVVAVICYALTGPSSSRWPHARRLAPSVVLLGGAPLALVLGSLASGRDGLAWLGTRSSTFEEFHPGEIPRWMLYLAADLVLFTAVVPVAASALVVGLGLSRRASETTRLFACVALPTFATMLLSVAAVSASLDVDGHENLNERYLFYVVPLTFVGLAKWVDAGLPQPFPVVWVVVACCAAVAASLPFERLEYNAGFQSPALLPWMELPLEGRWLAAIAGLSAFMCGALWLTCRQGSGIRLWLLVAACLSATSVFATRESFAPASYFGRSFADGPADWVDRAVPAHEQVPVVWDERRSDPTPDLFEFRIMVTEFFNARVGAVYRIGAPTYYERFLSTIPLRVGRDGALYLPGGEALEARHVLVTCRSHVRGRVVARAARDSLRLLAVDGRVRLAPGAPCVRDGL